MGLLCLLAIASVATGQGQAVLLRYADEPGLSGGQLSWNGRAAPLVRRGDEWIGMVGVDLDTAAGERSVEITFRYADGRTRTLRDAVAIAAVQYPTTELTVEERYVELSPEDQARAARDDEETGRIYATVTPEIYWAEPFASPIPGITSGRNFGHRRVFNGQPRAPHSGVDLRANTGTAIHAANRGRVVLAKDLFFSGNAVFIDHGLGVYSSYLHLSDIQVQVGDVVERGEVIGLAGATGRVTGPHLHWGARVLNARVDPFSLVKLVESGN
jgi:murein DD-endopeptidase MepM/ murein hydrolase activator NlpD